MATKPASEPRDDQAANPAEPSQRGRVRLLRLGSFDQPTYLTAPRGDRRRFVVERPGTIRVVQRGRVLGRPFLDISDRVTTGGEIHPDREGQSHDRDNGEPAGHHAKHHDR